MFRNFRNLKFVLRAALPPSKEKAWASTAWHITATLLFAAIWLYPNVPEISLLLVFGAALAHVVVAQRVQRLRDSELRQQLVNRTLREKAQLKRDLARRLDQLAGRVGVVREELESSLVSGVEGVRGELLAEVGELAGRVGVVREELESSFVSASELATVKESIRREITRTAKDALAEAHVVASAVSFLYEQISPGSPIWFRRGWAASPEFLAHLYQQIRNQKPQLVLDIGSGLSTVVAGHAVRQNGQGRVLAWEHLEEYAAQTWKLVEDQSLSDWVRVEFAPLIERNLRGQVFEWYSAELAGEDKIDVLIVDGPPGSTGPMARFPAIPLLKKSLSPSASVFLDDINRPEEREILSKWQVMLPPSETYLGGFESKAQFASIRLIGGGRNRIRSQSANPKEPEI